MTFAELSGYLDRLESTSSRNELVKTLADLYAKSSPDEIQPLTYLIQGRLVPFFEPVEIGLGEKLVIAAIAQAYATPPDAVASSSAASVTWGWSLPASPGKNRARRSR